MVKAVQATGLPPAWPTTAQPSISLWRSLGGETRRKQGRMSRQRTGSGWRMKQERKRLVEFNVNDRVICVDADFGTYNTANELYNRNMGGLAKGEAYTVVEVRPTQHGIRLVLKEIQRWSEPGFFATRFRKA